LYETDIDTALMYRGIMGNVVPDSKEIYRETFLDTFRSNLRTNPLNGYVYLNVSV